MKNLLLLLVLTISTVSFGQDEIGFYEMSFFSTKSTYTVSATEPKNDETTFYIETASADNNTVMLLVKSKKAEDFKAIIDSARVTYENWSQTAKENNVTELDKEIKIDKLNIECAFRYGSWHFDFSVQLMARFKILSTGEHVLIIENKGKLQSSSNQYIDAKGFYLVFTSSEEIENFINSLSEEKAKEIFEQKKTKDDLFKD